MNKHFNLLLASCLIAGLAEAADTISIVQPPLAIPTYGHTPALKEKWVMTPSFQRIWVKPPVSFRQGQQIVLVQSDIIYISDFTDADYVRVKQDFCARELNC